MYLKILCHALALGNLFISYRNSATAYNDLSKDEEEMS